MKVFILRSDIVLDVAYEVIDHGDILGVYISYEAAVTAKTKIIHSYGRTMDDYSIDVYEIKKD